MKILTGGELLVDCLVRQGVGQVFSIIGGQLGTVYDAIGNSPDIDVYVPRCETVAPAIACGYTASCGIPSVSSATVGAGVVYEVAGLLQAWLNYIPIVSIAPQVQSYKMKPHQENLQACNQDEIFYPVTKWNAIIYHWDRIPQLINRGFREALSGIPGPVHLDVPVDVLFRHKILTAKKGQRILPQPERTRYIGAIPGDLEAIKKAASGISGAKKPVIIVGQGVGRVGRYRGIRRILNELGMPVVATPPSFGFLCGKDECNAGDISMYSRAQSGAEAMNEADVLLIIGMDHHSKGLVSSLKDSTSKAIVQIESDPSAFLTGRPGYFGLYADPQSALSKIQEALKGSGDTFSSWRNEFKNEGESIANSVRQKAGFFGAKSMVAKLARVSTENDIIVADGELSVIYATCILKNAVYKDLFILDDRDIRGAGLPYAIGATIANPSSRVVLLCDKNSLFYNVREIQPAVSAGLDFSILCLDNADSEDNVSDSGVVLEGLGCEVADFDPGKTSAEDLLKHKAGAPGAYICKLTADKSIKYEG